MNSEQRAALSLIIEEVIADEDSLNWLRSQRNAVPKAFAMAPRKLPRKMVEVSPETAAAITSIRSNFILQHLSLDQLGRTWLLLQFDPTDADKYVKDISNLFNAAEIKELAVLYSALPILAYPEKWKERCAEGIRSNMGDVLDAIIYQNPYPSEQLPEAAWNQLVLKAFFTSRDINRIIGIDEKRNPALAATLIDYAHERWAASRTVDPQLWRCVAPFIDESNYKDLEKIAGSVDAVEKHAAILACSESNYPPAIELVQKHPDLKTKIETGALSWHKLATASHELV